MNTFKNYANFVKFEHSLFSLPVIFAGAFLAKSGVPSVNILILIIIAGTAARTAALAINRIIDRKIDKQNPRTRERELPSGKINIYSAVLVAITGLVIYFISAYKICWFVFLLSPVPILIFIIYPLMKRFTFLCHFGVGLGLSMAPLGGWVAVRCSLDDILPGILLGVFTLFWVSGFDIIYATLDENFDNESGIYSMVSVFGKKQALLVSAVLHILSFLVLVLLYLIGFSSIFSAIILFIIGYFLYLEHKKSENVDLAFFKINIVIGMLVFVFVIAGIYLP